MPPLTHLDRAAWWRVGTVVAIVTISRLVNTAFYLLVAPPHVPHDDAALYEAAARTIAANGFGILTDPARIPEVMTLRGLGHPLFLSAVYVLAGTPNHALAVWVQAFLLLPATVLLTYALGRTFDHRTGALAALLYAVYLPVVWHANILLGETFMAFIVTLFLWLLALFLKARRAAVGFLAGVVLAAISLSHTAWLLLIWVMLVALVVCFLATRSLRASWPKLAAVIVGAALVLGGWHAFRTSYDLPTIGQGNVGSGQRGLWNFYIGSRAETDGRVIGVDRLIVENGHVPQRLEALYERAQNGEVTIEPIMLAIIAEKLAAADPADRVLTNADYLRAGLANWLDQPLQIPGLLLSKTVDFLILRSGVKHQFPENVLFNPTWIRVFKAINVPLVLLAFGGLWRVWRRQRTALLLFVPLAFQSAVVILTHVEQRYKFPNMPAALLLAAVAAWALWEWAWPRLKARRARQR